jgi:glutamate-1-semialdehyde 2,1-aminomutase
MSSRRFPGKVMTEIDGMPAVEMLIRRLAKARRLDGIWLACSTNPADNSLAEFVQKLDFPVFRGDEDDALGRFAECAASAAAEIVVRITGDCPLIDADIVDQVVSAFHSSDADYVSNTVDRSYPDGLDVEVFSRK